MNNFKKRIKKSVAEMKKSAYQHSVIEKEVWELGSREAKKSGGFFGG
jgi:hypothetical protein